MSDHYSQHPSGIEAIELTKHESFLRGNILKYVLRAPYKGTEYEDLLKAKKYLDWEIERVGDEIESFEDFGSLWDDAACKLCGDECDLDPAVYVRSLRDEWDTKLQYVWDGKRYVSCEDDEQALALAKLKQRKFFDELVWPEKCQECDGACKVCDE